MPKTFKYIPLPYHDNVRNFEYKCSNKSIVYNLFVSNMCDKLITFFPKTLA